MRGSCRTKPCLCRREKVYLLKRSTSHFEAERKPASQRNVKREQEYKKLKVDQETHKVGQ